MSKASVCDGCRAPLAENARFCGQCGRASTAHREELRSRIRSDMSGSARAGASIAIIFIGVLLSLIVFGSLTDEPSEIVDIVAQAGQLIVGLVACAILGRDAWRASVPLATQPRYLVLATLGGFLTMGLTLLYVLGLERMIAAASDEDFIVYELDTGVLSLVSIVLLAPLIEEWLCRGVLWHALGKVAGVATTILLSAALFALLHGLEAWVFSLPHRFALGVIAGWLRWKSGSLTPAIWIHAVHNAIAVSIE